MGQWDVGTPSCWSGFCYLWASFFGMQSDLCRFLKGRSSTELCILGQDLCRQSESIVWDRELENCHWDVLTLAWAKASLVTENWLAHFLWKKRHQGYVCAFQGGSDCSMLWHAWRELNVATSQQCREDVEEGASACSWECIARLLACYCLVLCFIVFLCHCSDHMG